MGNRFDLHGLKTFSLFIFFIIAGLLKSNAQTSLEGYYSNLHLQKGNYNVTGKLYVLDSLLVDPGVVLHFKNNSSLIITGYAKFTGLIRDSIVLEGEDAELSEGIVIKNHSISNLDFEYVRFSKLTTPIKFIDSWYRSNVKIRNCVFENNTDNSTTLYILNPYITPELTYKQTNIIIDNNVFSSNKSPIYIEDYYSLGLNITIKNNVFSDNLIEGNGFYTYFSNVIFGRLDKINQPPSPFIYNNAFVNNYLYDVDSDTIVQKSNMGIYGTSDALELGDNYFDGTSKLGFYDNQINYTSPRIVFNSKMEARQDFLQTIPTHIVRMYDSSNKTISYDYDLVKGLKSFFIASNKPIDFSQLRLVYVYQRTGKKIANPFLSYKTAKIDSLTIKVEIEEDSLFSNSIGYIKIDQLRGENKDYISETKIGYIEFLKNKRLKEELTKMIPTKDTVETKKEGEEEVMRNRFQLGILPGYALYYGTLSNKRIFKNDLNTSFGFNVKYILSKSYSLSLTIQNTTLTGSDYKSGDSLKIRRGLSFKTPVLTASFQIFRDFQNNRVYYKNKLIPSFGFGVGYTRFNPMGQYLGKWYNLNSLGTGGQLLPGAVNKPYALSTLGSVLSGELNFFKSKKIIIGANISYHFTFTNYLDDVGPDPFPNESSILNQGGDNAQATIYFSNPTRVNYKPQQLRSATIEGYDSFMTLTFKISKIF